MIVTCLSLSGSPGTSTTALMLALHNNAQRSYLIEADPVGSSPTLAGYLQGQVRHDRSLVNLVTAHTRGQLDRALEDQMVPLTDTKRVRVLPGLVHTRQTQTVTGLWTPLADLLGGLSTQGAAVVIDAGRFGHSAYARDLVVRSDLILIVQRPTRVAVAATRSALPTLRSQLEQARSRAPIGLAVVGDSPYSAKECAGVLGLPLAMTIPNDPKGARQYSEGLHLRGFSRTKSTLLQSVSKLWPSAVTFEKTHEPDWLAAKDEGVTI